tara:strand:- start:52 stop:417 length:366 start_codon:yes stop_codon:yes gene_type:complete
MFDKIKSWVEKRWKAVLAFFGVVLGAFFMYMRSKDQKEILDFTNKSHKKELDANEEAEKKLDVGVEKILEKEEHDLKSLDENYDKKKSALKGKKDKFIKEAQEDDDLAKNLAEKLGADFVE